MKGDMRAVVYLAPGQIALRRVPFPQAGTGELVVKVRAALTCGTDVKTYLRGHPKFPPPFVFGHEFGGDVVEVGPGAEGFQVGQRVTANVFAECGECFFCRRAQGNLCERLEYNFGAFAEGMRLPASIVRRNTFVIPEALSYAQAAVLEPLVTVVHGQNVLGIQPGETVAVLGAGGPVSLLHIQLARRAGAGQVIAIGHSDRRLEAARLCGAQTLVNAHRDDPLRVVRERSGGYGADAVIECAGNQAAWEQAVELVRRGGRVLWFGGLPGGTQVQVDAARVHYGEITLLNTHGGSAADALAAFELLARGEVDTQPLLSAVYPLEEVETALRAMKAGEIVKGVIIPD